jgi:hypothetical protein
MKNLLLLLLLANILYFVWGMVAEDPIRPGVSIINESDLGPPLAVSQRFGTSASVGAALGSGDPSDLAAVTGRSCVSIGPFQATADAETARTQYTGEGMRTSLRSSQGLIFVGHWVQIRDIADRQSGNAILKKLADGGLTDAYLVDSDDEGLKISLGLFGESDRAEKIELQAKSLDLPAEITERTREGAIFYVDIGLPPGRGAGAIIEKYGEDKVLLREKATCPRSR